MRINKWLYVWIVQGNYDYFGWEDLVECDVWKDARQTLKEYRDNETQYPHRAIKRRVPNPEYK